MELWRELGPVETEPWNKTWMMMFAKRLDKGMQDKLIEQGSKPLALKKLMTLIHHLQITVRATDLQRADH
ncbi:uncharacterized protein BDCG_16730 [Blastomyces dermatitidis ER-3]|uniref:Uncharacterized protein n=1 Tax=Ajellomyces dermatitidis (strain ER-3 / ATCC MYA-2586) TaxID=559297 RepID=A0ABX2VU05_AJEDR|nr:uncharacterized protein BDCG_16730 [Blastomyces dermatitidis ER-3]OAT00669.1 hypothetical protein BDCG_16730 [Blastomyces dermatitidis ER-3]